MSQPGPDAPPTESPADDQADAGIFAIALHVSVPAQVDLRRVPIAFGDGAGRWLGERLDESSDGTTSSDPSDVRRYLCDLRLRVSPEGRALFRKSAIVGAGRARRTAEGWTVPIEWRAASLAPLFPVFAGRLSIGPDRIAVDGFYAPPFGVVGYVLDRAVMSIVAHGTARWFLGLVTEALAS
jgi:hypothetical protein